MPRPIKLTLHKKSARLEIQFDDQVIANLSGEYLRVYSPSAEVRGHGPGQEVLQVGKENVAIEKIEPVGNYAIKLLFSDGHDTGIYSWDYLYELATTYDKKWQSYRQGLKQAGYGKYDPKQTQKPQ